MTQKRSWWKTAVGLILTAIMLFPIYWMINVSLTQTQNMRKSPPDWFPFNPTFDGYVAVVRDQLPYLGVSLLVGLGTVLLTLVLSAPAAYSLAKLRPRGGGKLSFILLIAQMIPGIIMAMGFYAIYLNIGLLNSIGGLIIADSTIAVPFGVLIFTAFMEGIPDELTAAARIDGAGAWRTFRSIILPISRNSIVTVSLFTFLWAWSDFIFASTLDGGGDLQPITLGIYKYIGNNNQEWNSIMATAVIASIPTALLLVVAQRYVAAGVTAIGRTSARVLSALYLVASLALIVGLVALAYRVWRENRGTFSLMSTRLRLALYGSVIGLVVVIATSSLWVSNLLTSLVFFALVGGLGYVIWRIWEESRRYYY